MVKRLHIYFKEMFPLPSRLFVSCVLFFEMYFLVILTYKDVMKMPHIGIQEFVGCVTIFAFLLSLRIADEFKDFETDKVLFPERPYPSGKVKTKDLATVLVTINATAVILNIIFMPRKSLIFYGILLGYGTLMSLWFFSKYKIQKNLILALITHNPIQLFINLYIIAFACIKYNIPLISFTNVVIMFTLYFPGLIYEVSRKTRAPQDETDYVTYSKLWGYKKATKFILAVMFFDMITSSILVYKLLPAAVVTVIASYFWLVKKCFDFMKDPTKFKLLKKMEIYEYITEGSVIVIEAVYIFTRYIL